MVKKLAWQFVLDNNFKDFSVSIDVIAEIIKSNNWRLLRYSCSADMFKSFGIEEMAKNSKAFTYVYERSIDTKNNYAIFYNDHMEYKEIIFTLLHEIGHIQLNHVAEKGVLGKSTDKSQNDILEKEADLFACEVVAPSCILKKLNIDTVDEIIQKTFISEKEANLYIQKIHETKYRKHEDLELSMCIEYREFINKEFFNQDLQYDSNISSLSYYLKNNQVNNWSSKKSSDDCNISDAFISKIFDLDDNANQKQCFANSNSEKVKHFNKIILVFVFLVIVSIAFLLFNHNRVNLLKSSAVINTRNNLLIDNNKTSKQENVDSIENSIASEQEKLTSVKNDIILNQDSIFSDLSGENVESISSQDIVNSNNDVVYITKSGIRFHKSNCRYIISNTSVREISLQDTESQGLTPCKVCRPLG